MGGIGQETIVKEKEGEKEKPKPKNVPVKQFKCGGVVASIWENPVKKGGVIKSVSLQRVYKDTASGEWKYSSSLNANDVPKAIAALKKAWGFLVPVEEPEAKEAGELAK